MFGACTLTFVAKASLSSSTLKYRAPASATSCGATAGPAAPLRLKLPVADDGRDDMSRADEEASVPVSPMEQPLPSCPSNTLEACEEREEEGEVGDTGQASISDSGGGALREAMLLLMLLQLILFIKSAAAHHVLLTPSGSRSSPAAVSASRSAA